MLMCGIFSVSPLLPPTKTRHPSIALRWCCWWVRNKTKQVRRASLSVRRQQRRRRRGTPLRICLSYGTTAPRHEMHTQMRQHNPRSITNTKRGEHLCAFMVCLWSLTPKTSRTLICAWFKPAAAARCFDIWNIMYTNIIFQKYEIIIAKTRVMPHKIITLKNPLLFLFLLSFSWWKSKRFYDCHSVAFKVLNAGAEWA